MNWQVILTALLSFLGGYLLEFYRHRRNEAKEKRQRRRDKLQEALEGVRSVDEAVNESHEEAKSWEEMQLNRRFFDSLINALAALEALGIDHYAYRKAAFRSSESEDTFAAYWVASFSLKARLNQAILD